jgi:hypothetical protein
MLTTSWTRVLEFGRFALRSRAQKEMSRPETFTFLGFVHLCGRRRNDMPQFQRRTAKSTSTNGQPSRCRELKLVECLETFRSNMCGGWATKA